MKNETTKKRATKKILKAKKTPLELFKGKNKLNAKAKKLWLEALRSGEFSQSKARLCTIKRTPSSSFISRPELETFNESISYCCLGVLCEVLIKNNFPILKTEKEDSKTPCVSYKFAESDTHLYMPMDVATHIGLDDGKSRQLATMNDGCTLDGKAIASKTFEEIANYIEKNL